MIVKAEFSIEYEVPEASLQDAYRPDEPIILQETENLEEGDYLISLLADSDTKTRLERIQVTQ